MSIAATTAGAVSTAIFVVSYLPMLIKAGRSKDLRSYSAANLVLASIGNILYTWYVVSLPLGPIYLLHGFYLGATALMLTWYVRYAVRRRRAEPAVADAEAPPVHQLRADPAGDDLAGILTRSLENWSPADA